MSRTFLVTGANGHLGSTIIRSLVESGESVRGLVLPNDKTGALDGVRIPLFAGDVTRIESLQSFFAGIEPEKTVVIHTAGIVSIESKVNDLLHAVNVEGTRNICDLCSKMNIGKLIYVSSVHAIPEEQQGKVITETERFSPDMVVGGYAKTKAEATAYVLSAIRSGRVRADIVHPSGIIGPYAFTESHTNQMIMDFARGTLTAAIRGGYDFVDVRDVAEGIISLARQKGSGQTYLLTNQFYEVTELLGMLHRITGRRKIRTILPLWFAKGTAALSELYYKILKQAPLYTSYSLYTLGTNAVFSHEKADRLLGYTTRSMEETLRDTIDWMKSTGRLKGAR